MVDPLYVGNMQPIYRLYSSRPFSLPRSILAMPLSMDHQQVLRLEWYRKADESWDVQPSIRAVLPVSWGSTSSKWDSPLTSVTVYKIPPGRRTYAYSAINDVLPTSAQSLGGCLDGRDDSSFMFPRFEMRIREQEEHFRQLSISPVLLSFQKSRMTANPTYLTLCKEIRHMFHWICPYYRNILISTFNIWFVCCFEMWLSLTSC